jgi:uncharacterized delta-60 repeat protein
VPSIAPRRARRRPVFRRPHCESLESRRLLSAGDLDPSFAGDGAATIDLPGSLQDSGLAVAVQGDGKFVVASVSDQHMAVTRYLPNGSLDTGFGTAGAAHFRFGQPIEVPRDIAIDSLGRIVVAGVSERSTKVGDFAVARLTPAGQLDPSFDGDGKALIDFGGNYDGAVGVALRADNSILLAGITMPATPTNPARAFALAALREDGTPNPTFGGGDGQVVAPVVLGGAIASDMVVDSAGRIVVGGTTGTSGTGSFAVAR